MSHTSDVVIIGGGVIGVCAAYYLTGRGLDVTLVERGEIGGGCSYGNAGLVCPSHSLPLAAPGVLGQGIRWMLRPDSPFYIKPRLDLELLRWLWRFRTACREEPTRRAIPLFRDMQRASLILYQDVVAREGLACFFEQIGGINLYRSPASFRREARELALLREFGLAFRELDAAEVREIVPSVRPDIEVGILHQEDGHLSPARFVRQLAEKVQQQGATLLTQTTVHAIEVERGWVRTVRTSGGDLSPAQVVLAAGAWSAELGRDLGLELPIQPAKGYSVTMARPDDLPDIPIHCVEARTVITPMGPEVRLAGTFELSGFDPTIDRRRVAALRRAPSSYVTGLEGLEETEVWQGYRPVPPDGLPYIGRTRAVENLVVATGHSYLGLSMGPITGKLVEQIVCEEAPLIDLSLMAVDRFA